MQHASDLIALVTQDTWRMDVLYAVRSLGLNDCWVGAGFVRALVWDHLSAYTDQTPLRDIDVVFYDESNTEESFEKMLDQKLLAIMKDIPWSCKNQARMYLKFGMGVPYRSTEDGLRHWLETSAAVAVRLNDFDAVEILAPFGLEDTFNLSIRPTPFAVAHRMDDYRHLAATKPWKQRWPRLQVLGADGAPLRA